MIEEGGERWRRLTVKEGWRRFVSDEPTRRPERVRVADYRRLDERSRSAYDVDRKCSDWKQETVHYHRYQRNDL